MLSVGRALKDNQVLQRGPDGMATLSAEGLCEHACKGVVEGRVLDRGFPIEGLDWQPVGRAAAGSWTITIPGIPTGGPYRIELRTADGNTMLIRDILVGDIWFLAGQSNMEGVGELVDVEPQSPLVHSFDMSGQWVVAEEPLHWLCDSADPVHAEQREPDHTRAEEEAHAARTHGAGLGLPFANEMVRRTGVPVGLVPCAHGGTSMDDWDPALRDMAGRSLYGSMLRRLKGVGGKARGILWYQGESDANGDLAPAYEVKLRRFIESVRADFGRPDLPFHIVQIARYVGPAEASANSAWSIIREAQRRVTESTPNTYLVASIDLPLCDGVHLSTDALKRLGRRLAHSAATAVAGTSPTSPTLADVKLEGNALRLSFHGVNDGFCNHERLSGFCLSDVKECALSIVYNVAVDANRPSDIIVWLTEPPAPDVRLWYGYGTDLYCNVRDGADMAVPAFGPVAISR